MTVCVFTAATPNRSKWILVRTHYNTFCTWKTYQHIDINYTPRYRLVCVDNETGAYIRTVLARRV